MMTPTGAACARGALSQIVLAAARHAVRVVSLRQTTHALAEGRHRRVHAHVLQGVPPSRMVSIEMVVPEIGIVGDPAQGSRCGRASERKILQADVAQDVQAQLVRQLLHRCVHFDEAEDSLPALCFLSLLYHFPVSGELGFPNPHTTILHITPPNFGFTG